MASQEEHIGLRDDTILQLKQPNLGWINPRFFAVYFDNCICHQNCNRDMFLGDDARLVLVTAIYGQCGQCSPCGVQQQVKFTLSTKILVTVKTDWPL